MVTLHKNTKPFCNFIGVIKLSHNLKALRRNGCGSGSEEEAACDFSYIGTIGVDEKVPERHTYGMSDGASLRERGTQLSNCKAVCS